jgi:hypothetical protein
LRGKGAFLGAAAARDAPDLLGSLVRFSASRLALAALQGNYAKMLRK